jgi:hypothetical protein
MVHLFFRRLPSWSTAKACAYAGAWGEGAYIFFQGLFSQKDVSPDTFRQELVVVSRLFANTEFRNAPLPHAMLGVCSQYVNMKLSFSWQALSSLLDRQYASVRNSMTCSVCCTS